MRTEIQKGIEIASDGKTVWINGADGCCIGRFCRNGIDIHHDAKRQIALGHQCMDCKAGPCTASDWEDFKAGMLRSYGVLIGDKHIPRNIA